MMESYGVTVSGSQLGADCINTMKTHAHPTRVHVWRHTVISWKKRAPDHVSSSSSSTSSLFFFFLVRKKKYSKDFFRLYGGLLILSIERWCHIGSTRTERWRRSQIKERKKRWSFSDPPVSGTSISLTNKWNKKKKRSSHWLVLESRHAQTRRRKHSVNSCCCCCCLYTPKAAIFSLSLSFCCKNLFEHHPSEAQTPSDLQSNPPLN